MSKTELKISTVDLFGLRVVTNSQTEFWSFLKQELHKGKKTRLLMTPNPEQVVLAEKDEDFKESLQEADWLIPDGAGLVWASKYFFNLRLRTKKCQERITGADTVAKILTWAQKEKWRVLVIGGFYDEWTVDEKSELENGNLKKVKLMTDWEVEWTSGYQVIGEPQEEEEREVVRIIEEWQPDIVLVAFGAPGQEKWLKTHQSLLKKNEVRLGMAVGGSIDFLVGKASRAPKIMQKHGGEWFYRLIKQPWRWRRQLALGKFLGLVADEANKELKSKK